jgi:hypothetical protein
LHKPVGRLHRPRQWFGLLPRPFFEFRPPVGVPVLNSILVSLGRLGLRQLDGLAQCPDESADMSRMVRDPK